MPRIKPDLSWTRINIDAPELFPIHKTDSTPGTEQDTEAVLIPRESIEPNPANPRRHFDLDALKELGESLKLHGLLQPIVVRHHPAKEGKFQIIFGERRWIAAGTKYADLPVLQCRVRDVSESEARTLALIENINREDLTPTERGNALLALKDVNASLHWSDIAKMVGRTRQWVNDCVSLVEQPLVVQAAVDEHKITPTHARAVRQLPAEQQVKMVQSAIRHNLTTEQLAERVKEIKAPAEPKAPTAQSTPSAPPQLTIVPEVLPAADLQTALFHIERAAREMSKLHNPQQYYHKELRKNVAALRARLDEIERVGVGAKAVEVAA